MPLENSVPLLINQLSFWCVRTVELLLTNYHSQVHMVDGVSPGVDMQINCPLHDSVLTPTQFNIYHGVRVQATGVGYNVFLTIFVLSINIYKSRCIS